MFEIELNRFKWREESDDETDFANDRDGGIRVDRISSLPNEIIHRILAFNDTKYAVQTSVLSSRWKCVWKSLPYLNFAESECRTYPKFTKFVNRLVKFRYNHCEVSSLYLCFGGAVRHVEKILSYVMSHNVQKMEIFARCPTSKCLYPLCLFSLESLKCLTLRSNDFCFGKYPLPQSPWDLPALTTLFIDDMSFRVDETGCIELFSKCVYLKNLTIRNCRSRDWEVMKIIAPRLENLSLIDSIEFNFIVLAPNLSSFEYVGNGWRPPSLSTGDFPFLDKVLLQLTFESSTSYLQKPKEDIQRHVNKFFSIFEELRNAKVLTLDSPIIEFLSALPDVLEHQPSPFRNLKCLKIKFDQMRESTNSAMIDKVIKYLFNSSSSANVIMELPKNRRFRPLIDFDDDDARYIAFGRRDVEQLCEVAEMLSLQEMTDPHTRQMLEDVKKKLAVPLQKKPSFGAIDVAAKGAICRPNRPFVATLSPQTCRR